MADRRTYFIRPADANAILPPHCFCAWPHGGTRARGHGHLGGGPDGQTGFDANDTQANLSRSKSSGGISAMLFTAKRASSRFSRVPNSGGSAFNSLKEAWCTTDAETDSQALAATILRIPRVC
jgi:hypothetical protein